MDIIELNQFPSVAANARATLVTDELLDTSVHALIFEMGGTFTKAQMTNIRIRHGGKDLVQGISGDQLQDLNDYDGLPDVTNYLVYFFGDPTARTARGEHMGDLDLSIYREPLEIEVDIGGATTPTLQMWAIKGVPKMDMGIGFSAQEAAHFRTLIRTQIQPAAAVTNKSYGISLGGNAGGRLRKVGFFHANLTKVELKKAGFTKVDDITVALNSAIAQQYARVPQSGLFVLDRIVDGNQGSAETTADPDGKPWNMRLSLTTSGGDTINAFADMHVARAML